MIAWLQRIGVHCPVEIEVLFRFRVDHFSIIFKGAGCIRKKPRIMVHDREISKDRDAGGIWSGGFD